MGRSVDIVVVDVEPLVDDRTPSRGLGKAAEWPASSLTRAINAPGFAPSLIFFVGLASEIDRVSIAITGVHSSSWSAHFADLMGRTTIDLGRASTA